MIKIIVLIFLFFSNLNVCFTQVSQQWAVRYHSYSEDQAKDIAVDDSGNVYVTGSSEAPTPNGAKFDYATIKYNSAGVMQWVRRYNGPGNDRDDVRAMVIDDSGNVYVTGLSNRVAFPGLADYDFATVKYDRNGIEKWVRRYDSGQDQAEAIGIDSFGNIYVGGVAGSDLTVIKYSPNGDSLWVRKYDSGSAEGFEAMALDDDGNVYLAGWDDNEVDWQIVKFNPLGEFQWVRTFNGPGNGADYPKSISVDDSSNVYVTGYVWANNTTNFATVKYDSVGDQKWASFYPNASALALTLDDSSNVYVTGANGNMLTIKYDPLGNEKWVMNFNGPGNAADIPCCIETDDSANVYITGYASITPNNRDYCTIKYNKLGAQQWVMFYGVGPSQAPGDDATALAVDSYRNVFVTGNSYGDFATIKYSQTLGISQISNEVPSGFKLFQNFPNPFNPTTKIKFEISKLSFARVVVFDILGREIKTIFNGYLRPGIYEVNFDGNNFSSGVYYYKMITDDYSEIKKMILVK